MPRRRQTDSLGVGDGGIFGEAEIVGDVLIVGQPAVGAQQPIGTDSDLEGGQDGQMKVCYQPAGQVCMMRFNARTSTSSHKTEMGALAAKRCDGGCDI